MNGNGNFVYDDTCVGDVKSGQIEATLTSLKSETTYYYRAFVRELNKTNGEYEFRYGGVNHFTTGKIDDFIQKGWLELPAKTTGGTYYTGSFGSGKTRNYSYLYDLSMYTSLWTAYPLTSNHIKGSASTTTWNFNPNLENDVQINVKSNSYGTNYGKSMYSRGHQIPAADRKCDDTMRAQTYYLTNQTPQNQNGFNSPMWSNLEETIRDLTSSTDTVYVVTGAAFRKVGQNESISYLTAAKAGILPESIPIPNYYWKVLLKVKRNGDVITEASTVAVWMPHNSYSSATAWQEYVCSVKQIEDWTGFNFFDNLPDSLEQTAEQNTSWSSFENF